VDSSFVDRCARVAHPRQSRPYSGLGFQVKVLKTRYVVPSSAVITGEGGSCPSQQKNGDTNPCRMTGLTLHGVASPERSRGAHVDSSFVGRCARVAVGYPLFPRRKARRESPMCSQKSTGKTDSGLVGEGHKTRRCRRVTYLELYITKCTTYMEKNYDMSHPFVRRSQQDEMFQCLGLGLRV
jgi:hypothetical protein